MVRVNSLTILLNKIIDQMEKKICNKVYITSPYYSGNSSGALIDVKQNAIKLNSKTILMYNAANDILRKFSKEEKEILAEDLGITADKLNPLAEGSFWNTYRVELKANTKIDLSTSLGFASYLILKSNSNIVTEGKENLSDTPGALWVMFKDDEDIKIASSEVDMKYKAFSIINKYENDDAKLRDMLTLYLNKYDKGKKVGPSVSIDFIKGYLKQEADKNPSQFIELMEDELFSVKLLLAKALELGIMSIRNFSYFTEFNPTVPIASSYQTCIEYLQDYKANGDIISAIEAKILEVTSIRKENKSKKKVTA